MEGRMLEFIGANYGTLVFVAMATFATALLAVSVHDALRSSEKIDRNR
jgi:hypothetical protein